MSSHIDLVISLSCYSCIAPYRCCRSSLGLNHNLLDLYISNVGISLYLSRWLSIYTSLYRSLALALARCRMLASGICGLGVSLGSISLFRCACEHRTYLKTNCAWPERSCSVETFTTRLRCDSKLQLVPSNKAVTSRSRDFLMVAPGLMTRSSNTEALCAGLRSNCPKSFVT